MYCSSFLRALPYASSETISTSFSRSNVSCGKSVCLNRRRLPSPPPPPPLSGTIPPPPNRARGITPTNTSRHSLFSPPPPLSPTTPLRDPCHASAPACSILRLPAGDSHTSAPCAVGAVIIIIEMPAGRWRSGLGGLGNCIQSVCWLLVRYPCSRVHVQFHIQPPHTHSYCGRHGLSRVSAGVRGCR